MEIADCGKLFEVAAYAHIGWSANWWDARRLL
jgi:hypothetical protein